MAGVGWGEGRTAKNTTNLPVVGRLGDVPSGHTTMDTMIESGEVGGKVYAAGPAAAKPHKGMVDQLMQTQQHWSPTPLSPQHVRAHNWAGSEHIGVIMRGATARNLDCALRPHADRLLVVKAPSANRGSRLSFLNAENNPKS